MTPEIRTEEAVIDMIRSRGVVGREKYGTSMDRSDLTLTEWITHFQQELADGLQYAERMKGGAQLLERARALLGEFDYVEVKEWCEDYDRQFTAKAESDTGQANTKRS